MFVVFIIVIHLVVGGNCFLLDGTPNNGGQTQTSNQFLTVSEFQQEKKTLQQDTENLRHDLDKTISILTSQLNLKFEFLDHKVEENTKKNDTNFDYVTMDMHLALTQKFNLLQNENSVMKREHYLMKNELKMLQNTTSEYERKIADLQQMGNIKPLQEIGTLQHAVHANTATIQSLSMNERARSQDFLALYNLTMESKRKHDMFESDVNNQLTSIRANHNMNLSNLSSEIQANEKHNNLSVALIEGKFTDINNTLVNIEANHDVTAMEIRSKIAKIETQTTSTISSLKKRMDEQVALTSHPSSTDTLSSGQIMKFDNVAFSVGVNNLSVFKSSGKFVCKIPGLYLITATVDTRITGDPQFNIILNGSAISKTEIGSEKTSIWRGGTGIVARLLVVNDAVWIQAQSAVSLEGSMWSQFTIIKIS